MGLVTLARTKGHIPEKRPIVKLMERVPKVSIGVPLAAERTEVDAGCIVISAWEAGKTLTAAPVSTKSWVPLPGFVKVNKLLKN